MEWDSFLSFKRWKDKQLLRITEKFKILGDKSLSFSLSLARLGRFSICQSSESDIAFEPTFFEDMIKFSLSLQFSIF